MPRPRKVYRTRALSVRLPIGLIETLNIATEDFLKPKPEFGKRSEIVESLLRQWLIDNGHEELLKQKMKECQQ